MSINEGRWWNVTRKTRRAEKQERRPSADFDHHKTYMDWRGIDQDLRCEKPAVNHLT
jgi:hypothetical protein